MVKPKEQINYEKFCKLPEEQQGEIIKLGLQKQLRLMISCFFMVLLFSLAWPKVNPFGFFGVWNFYGNPGHWLIASSPLVVYSILLGIIAHRFIFGKKETQKMNNEKPEQIFKMGIIVSTWAAITEEIQYRWLSFYIYMFIGLFTNFLFFGFLGFGLIEWLHLNFFGPIANCLTLGYLHEYILNEHAWYVGFAILSSNTIFRDGHLYQGWFGAINSWFVGMALFWIMFHFGLPAAIMAHFLYDFCILSLVTPMFVALEQDKKRKSLI